MMRKEGPAVSIRGGQQFTVESRKFPRHSFPFYRLIHSRKSFDAMQTVPVKPLVPWFQVISDLDDSMNPASLFDRRQPLQLDIGCGRGLFVVTAASVNSTINYLGLEIDYREGRRAATRLMKRNLPNARIMGGDCKPVLTKMLPESSVDAAHVYFPDPWWKKRHHKRRLFTESFVGLLARVVRPGGHVHSWSDVAEYFELISQLMNGHQQFLSCEPPGQRDPEHDMDYQTSFERKKRKLGLPIYRGLWQRQ
jgi:tRNA (guanine-N7-)-methyltransferase